MNAIVPREKLAAVLGLLGSEHYGEVLAAARVAERLRAQAGATWGELLAPAPPATRRLATASPPGWRATAAACRAHSELLTPWERAFLAELATYRRAPSGRQAGILASIAAKVLG